MTPVKQAMILAAGLGSRMGSLTQDIPKPMLMVEDISLIERSLLYLKKNHINKVVINTYYKASLLEGFIRSLAINAELDILFSREDELLGTGGGIKNALSILGKEAFFVLNSDAIFVDDNLGDSSFIQLQKAWNPTFIPMMLLLTSKDKAFGYWSKGDFNINNKRQLDQKNEIRPFINTGLSIMDYRLFDRYSDRILQLFPTIGQDLMQNNQLYGCVYNGDWYHIGDVKAYDEKPVIKS